jgi:hypothetical protein
VYLFEGVVFQAIGAAPKPETQRYYNITPDGIQSVDGSRQLYHGTASYVCWSRLVWVNGNPVIDTYEQLYSCDGILEPDDVDNTGGGGSCDDGNWVDDGSGTTGDDSSCGGGAGGDTGESIGGAETSGLNCDEEYVSIEEQDSAGNWHTIWEGWVNVCS